tara:strand:- start:2859 stop:3182 length:324 start_codon:yes stop_codon:yes gene_type:complete
MDDKLLEEIRTDIIEAIKTVYDPEISVDIYNLGLIYDINVNNDHTVDITMSLTSAFCPAAGDIPIWVENATVGSHDWIDKCTVKVTFDPPWGQHMMSDEAKIDLGFF